MNIIESNIIKRDKIIDNYLVNFPLFINKENNSIYKLVIGLNITCFVIKTPSEANFPNNGFTIRLPYYDFGDEHALFISWGDGISRRKDGTEFLTHTYYQAGVYEIYILGDTPNLYSIDYMLEGTVTPELNNFKSSLIDIKKLSDNLTDLKAIFKFYTNLSGIPDEPLPSQVKDCQELFYGCSQIQYIPFNFALPEEGLNFKMMFNWCVNLKTIFNDHFTLPYKTKNVEYMFYGCSKLEAIPDCLFNNVTSTLNTTLGMFKGCSELLLFNTTRKLSYITNIASMFQNCISLRTIKFNVPNVKNLNYMCWGCSSLVNIEGVTINLFTDSAHYAFADCHSLKQDIGEILTYHNTFVPSAGFVRTFSNCNEIIGTPKELYLWKSYAVGHLSPYTFENCTHLTNYNFITTNWGGPQYAEYWYGSYLIEITESNDIYCLPIYKFLTGDASSYLNQRYDILNPTLNTITPYDFYINYGDDSAWYNVIIGSSVFFNNLWLNDKTSPFYGYPLTYKINFGEGDKTSIYQQLIEDNMYGYVFRDIMHIYKEPGRYKIMIMGQMPRFYVQENDYKTNRHLYSIYTINNLPFVTLDHAFTNAYNLRYLPNESLLEFPTLSAPGNWEKNLSTLPDFIPTHNPSLPAKDCPLYNDDDNRLYLNYQENENENSSNYYSYDSINGWRYFGDFDYLTSNNIKLYPITFITLSTLTHDDRFHPLLSIDTSYCFATINGYDDQINNPRGSLFKINSTSTTFKFRTNVK